MKPNPILVSLRQKALYIPHKEQNTNLDSSSHSTLTLAANLRKMGFCLSEPLLRALNATSSAYKEEVYACFKEVLGSDKNWTPLVKGWDTPTGESALDHFITMIVNALGITEGAKLPCGHVIPKNTFPLDRYNGCPFCGTPFVFGELEKIGQKSNLKVLDLWTEKELEQHLLDLLESKTALDATQQDSLKHLLLLLPMPDAKIGMKETLMYVIDAYVQGGNYDKALSYFSIPTDVLRYLWFKQTGFAQLVEPKVVAKRHAKNANHLAKKLDKSAEAQSIAQHSLKLKYSRKMCFIVASWLNQLAPDAEKACESMHPKRGMWVRFIRALRLNEYSKKPGFEALARLLDCFQKERYPVWQGEVDRNRLRHDPERTFALLKQRPGLFARSLFANMLWFGAKESITAFSQVVDKVPTRLVLTLQMYAKNYFLSKLPRSVKPLGGVAKRIGPNPKLAAISQEECQQMVEMLEETALLSMEKRFQQQKTTSKRIYIEKNLFYMPLAIGDRSESVQDLPSALMGARFPVQGDAVRLFMQWGYGLSAQHLDMDLCCHIAYPSSADICSFEKLSTTGCKHSGDIRAIPEKIGTAEYIEININELQNAGALYVTFTCNAYSNGAISPNTVVGWMSCDQPMHISQTTGVAYDPSCVDHQVRITQKLSKGLVFGILDIAKREIIWMEMSYQGQVVQQLDQKGVMALLAKLDSKMSIGALLKIKAKAQGLEQVESPEEADEVYTFSWASDAAAVTRLFVD